jgi:hypothetical protein
MPTLAATNLTLADVAKRTDPDGSASAIAELLSQENEILMDMPWIEGNLPTGHRITTRTGLPDVAWRKLNAGVPQSKSTTAQLDETCGMLEGFGQVDKDIAELNGNTPEYRLGEAMAYIESINQTMAATLFNGDTGLHPERFLGLGPRFNSLSAENGQNIINSSGASNLTSVYLVGWAKHSVHGIYPKGSKAGLTHTDLGLETVTDASGNKYRAYLDHYQWKCGIALKDWRYVVRIANIDTAALTKNAASGTDLIDQMTRALERIQSLSGVTPVFYANRTIRSFLRRQTVNKVASSTLAYKDVGGVPTVSFAEVPVRRTDALTNSETAVA